MTVKVGQIRKMMGGYDGDTEVLITAVGMQNVLFVYLPLVYFNGALEEHKIRVDIFEKQTYMTEQESK